MMKHIYFIAATVFFHHPGITKWFNFEVTLEKPITTIDDIKEVEKLAIQNEFVEMDNRFGSTCRVVDYKLLRKEKI